MPYNNFVPKSEERYWRVYRCLSLPRSVLGQDDLSPEQFSLELSVQAVDRECTQFTYTLFIVYADEWFKFPLRIRREPMTSTKDKVFDDIIVELNEKQIDWAREMQFCADLDDMVYEHFIGRIRAQNSFSDYIYGGISLRAGEERL